MKGPRTHFGHTNHLTCSSARPGPRTLTTSDPSLVTCARCLKFLSTIHVKFEDVRDGERFIIRKRNGKLFRFVKVREFTDEGGALRNAIEVGTGLFWTMACSVMAVEVNLPRD